MPSGAAHPSLLVHRRLAKPHLDLLQKRAVETRVPRPFRPFFVVSHASRPFCVCDPQPFSKVLAVYSTAGCPGYLRSTASQWRPERARGSSRTRPNQQSRRARHPPHRQGEGSAAEPEPCEGQGQKKKTQASRTPPGHARTRRRKRPTGEWPEQDGKRGTCVEAERLQAKSSQTREEGCSPSGSGRPPGGSR